MRTFLWAFVVLAVPALAEDATHRLWETGPAYWERPCGLRCFAMAEAAGVKAGEISYAELAGVKTVDEMAALLEARSTRLAGNESRAAAGAGTPGRR